MIEVLLVTLFRFLMAVVPPPAQEAPPKQSCLSTSFGHPGDKWTGGVARCTGLPVGPETLGVAHRTLPCGTLVRIVNPNNGMEITVPVVDRGPYGALLEDGTWVVKRTAKEPGTWRGCLDLTPLAASRIGHTGKQVVLYQVR